MVMCTALLAYAPFMDANGISNFVVNGDFETGDFTGWTIANQTSVGYWFIYSGGILPISNLTTPPPPGGAYAASADETNPSAMILYQDITLPPNECLSLKYTYYYNNYYHTFESPDTLQVFVDPNQQARIDIMNPDTVDPYSVTPGDVLQNLLHTTANSPLMVDPTTVSFDLTSYAGQTIRLRFAVTDTENFLLMGVDNVSIQISQVQPPLNLSAEVVYDRFVTQTDLIYRLEWDASTTAGVKKYLIFRNGVYIASVANDSGILQYEDHNRRKGEVDQYNVVAYISNALQSEPASVIIH